MRFLDGGVEDVLVAGDHGALAADRGAEHIARLAIGNHLSLLHHQHAA
jgi:hypothetical protein